MLKVMVVGLVAVIAFLAGPMSAAHAGGMGLGPNVAFLCYLISGASPGGDVRLADQFGARENVKIGVARLVCTPVEGTLYQNLNLPINDYKNPAPPPCDAISCPGDHLKCYDIRSSKGDNPEAVVTLNDFFRPLAAQQVEEEVAVGSAQFLCVGALKTVVSPQP